MNINATLILQSIAMMIFVWFCMKFIWPPLLKALDEVASAPNAMMAAEMAVIRMTHVADLPTPGDLVKKLQSTPAPAGGAATRHVRPVKVFVSYSHKDEPLKDQLIEHLSLLQRRGVVDTWHDRRLVAGQDAEAVDGALPAAGIRDVFEGRERGNDLPVPFYLFFQVLAFILRKNDAEL